MLKKRIIPIMLHNQGRLSKSVSFSNFRDVGDPVKSAQVYSDQDADELILLDVDRNLKTPKSFARLVEEISRNCFVPLTVGGGIRSISDAQFFFEAGADKVVLSTALFDNFQLIKEISSVYGRQAVVACLDYKKISNNLILYSDNGSVMRDIDFKDFLSQILAAGVGELIIQSIDCDGRMTGYDLNIAKIFLELSSVPIVIAGGAGNFSHLKDAFELGVSGVACGSLFNFGDNNPLRAKAYLKNYGINLKKI